MSSRHDGRMRGGGARHGALGLLPFHDGVCCALRLYTEVCLYLTSQCRLRAAVRPPAPASPCAIRQAWASCRPIPTHACVTGALCSCFTASTSKPLPTMSPLRFWLCWLLLNFLFISVSWLAATFWPLVQLANSLSIRPGYFLCLTCFLLACGSS